MGDGLVAANEGERHVPAKPRGAKTIAAMDDLQRHRQSALRRRQIQRHRRAITAARIHRPCKARIGGARRVMVADHRRGLRAGAGSQKRHGESEPKSGDSERVNERVRESESMIADPGKRLCRARIRMIATALLRKRKARYRKREAGLELRRGERTLRSSHRGVRPRP